MADAAALLQRQGRFFQPLENARHGIVERSHDEAIEQRHGPCRTGPRDYPPCRQKAEIEHQFAEAFEPGRTIVGYLCIRDCHCNAGGCGREVFVGNAVGWSEAILGGPDFFGERDFEAHISSPLLVRVRLAHRRDRKLI